MSNPDPATAHLAAYALAGVLILAPALTAPFERRAYRSDPETRRKLIVYGTVVVTLWTLTAAAVRIDGWRRLLESPVAGAPWPSAPSVVAPVLGVGLAAFFVLALLPLAQSLRGPRWRGTYAAAIRRGFADLPGLLPNNAAERAAFVLVSLTAGVCEEVLFRGFLIRLVYGDSAAAMPLAGALAVSSLAFGLAHLYQGLKGVGRTTLAGCAFGLLFLLSGSLIPGILLHALMDLQMAYVLGPIPDAAACKAAETTEIRRHDT